MEFYKYALGLFRLGWASLLGRRSVTVFTDVELLEVNQAGDSGGQVGQVVIGHAQLLQSLAVEELLKE